MAIAPDLPINLANDFRESTQPLSNTKANVAEVSFGAKLGRKSAPAAGIYNPSSAPGDALDDGMKARGLIDRGLIDGSNGVKQEGSCQQTVKATEFKFFKEDCLPRLWQFANTMKPKPISSLVVL